MTVVQVEMLADSSNSAVLRLPGRKHPGVLVQGDSLSVLAGLAGEANEAIAKNDYSEAASALRELLSRLEEYQHMYEGALSLHDLAKPY
jgi:hypothetical protein